MSTSDKCQKQKRRCYNACDTGSRYIPFHCFKLNCDPETGKIKIGIGTVILFAPAFLTFLITFSIFSIINKNKQNQGGKKCD
jgi:hypothetical protein